MLKSLFLAAFILVIGCSQADDCVRGPSYWCQSIQNANKCNAFRHCLQTVWTTHNNYLTKSQIKLTNSPNACSNCVQCLNTDSSDCVYVHIYKEEVEQLKSYKIPNESICKILSECNEEDFESTQKLTDNNQVEYKFDSRFKCGLHPRNWCDNLETAKRCDSFETCLSKWSNLKYKLREQVNTMSDKTCGFCMFIFQKLHDSLQQNATEVNVKDYLEGACTLLPSQDLTDLCTQQIDKYLPEIYNMLRDNLDPGIICRVLKQCSDASLQQIEPIQKGPKNVLDTISLTVLNDKDVVIKTPLQNVNSEYLFGPKSDNLVDEMKRSMGVGCELCTIVMNAAKYMIQNEKDNRKVLNFIEKELCYRMGTLNSTCVEYVEQEGGEIISLLINSVDPAVICHAMGLCMKVQISDSEKFYDLNVRNPLNCTLCKVVFTQVKKMLTDQKSQAKILDYVDVNLCQKVGKSKELCKTLIDSYGPLFLEIIARDVKPDQLCVMIGMCASETIDEALVSQAQASGQYCVICEFFVTTLERYINENSTVPEIEKIMSYICEHVMPTSIRQECSTFVTTYGEIIISLIINQVPPNKVCTTLGLCNKTTSEAPKFLDEVQMFAQKGNAWSSKEKEALEKVQKPKFSAEIGLFKQKSNEWSSKEKIALQKVQESRALSIGCTVCQYAIQYISNEYQIDRTEKAFEFTIQNVCKLTPKAYRPYCESMIDTHGIRLITLMESYSDSMKICAFIKMCSIEEVKPVEMLDIVPAKPVQPKPNIENGLSLMNEDKSASNKTLVCSLCLYAAELVDEKLKQNKTEEQITKELLLVCNLFPAQLKDQCSAFINEYGPYVVTLIANQMNPETTCAALRVCDKSVINDPFAMRRDFLNRFQN